MQFAHCRHGESIDTERFRRCHSPKLAGLKLVSPQQCERCYCRDHDPSDDNGQQPLHLLSCAHLGNQVPSPSSDTTLTTDGDRVARSPSVETFQCLHPRHDRTTLCDCQRCEDYLYPVATPSMPVEMVQRLIALPAREQSSSWCEWENVRAAHRAAATEAINRVPAWQNQFDGRGIVVVGGGRYFVSAFVTIRVLRQVGCQLPIELWHLDGEIDAETQGLVEPYGVRCVNAEHVAKREPFRFLTGHWWRGWQLKAFALRHCSFREVLMLDSDCYPVRNPEFLFDWPRYREWGAVFWPDLERNRMLIPDYVWPIFGVEPFSELPTESGQLLVNKELCWREVNLALHYNAHADFVYHLLYGDKDTFPMAWQRLGRRYGRMWPQSEFDSVAIRQMDDKGDLLFLHRVHDKFRLPETTFDATPHSVGASQFQPHFPLERFCFDVVGKLIDSLGRRKS